MTITRVEELCRKLRPVMGRKIDALWYAYLTEDTQGKREIEAAIEIMAEKKLKDQPGKDRLLLPPPEKELCEGEYPLGKVCYNDKELWTFGLRENENIMHTGIFGISGSGKTNAGYIILQNLLKHKKPFLIFDWKRNYRDLISLPQAENILVFTVGRNICPFRFNPLIPPKGTPPEIWLKKLIEIIAHAYFLGEGVMHLLQVAIDKAYRDFGVYDGSVKKYPTLKDVMESLSQQHVKGRKSLWMDSTLRALGSLCFGEMGRVTSSQRQIDIKELLDKNVILELDGLVNDDKVFFIESLLLWIHHYRLAEGKREVFKHAIIIEEAHHILLKKKQELAGSESVTDTILREIRELGEAITLIDQHPSLISVPALGNTYCTIAFNLKHRSDVRTISDCMLISSPQERDFLGKLPIGTAIVKLQGRAPSPFLVKFPLFLIKKGVITDNIIKKRMQIQSYFRDLPEEIEENKKPAEITEVSERGKSVSELEKAFLIDICEHTLSGVVKRYVRLNINRRSGNDLKENLITKGFIQTQVIPTASGKVTLLKLTDKGIDLIRSFGHKIKVADRTGGLEHEFWKWKIGKYYLDKGYKVIKEKPIGEGKTIDIWVEKGGQNIAVEIETGKSDALANIVKSLKAGAHKIICVPTNQKAESSIKKQFIDKGFDKNEKIEIINAKKYGE